ncbi:MAG: zinc-finger domain-containing protein [Kordiimonas sp.]|nr:zinc-finger domain-containing protein [Kordiimonas sp.]
MTAESPEVVYTDKTRTSCDGGEGPLGHPRVYLEMGQKSSVVCPYCGRKFILKTQKSA